MEIRTLRYFLAVAREEHMTRAAELLHVTQPTLSKQLKSLEEELGQKLFTRGNFSIRLTEEGRLLRDRAASLVEMADRIESEFGMLAQPESGELFFGLAESVQIRLLAREVAKLKRECPGLRYHITSGDTEQIIDRLDRGLLDFAVLAERPDFQKYRAIAFPEADVWGALMPADSPLAEKESLTVDDLVGVPLLCSEQGWRGEIAAWCEGRIHELQLDGSCRLPYNPSLFVREGLGVFLTFRGLFDTAPGSGLAFRPLSPRLETRLYLIWKKYPSFSRTAARFAEMAENDFPREAAAPA